MQVSTKKVESDMKMNQKESDLLWKAYLPTKAEMLLIKYQAK
jgi:hypothetical protein